MAKKLNAKKKGAKDAPPDKIIGKESFVKLLRYVAGKQGKIDTLAGEMGGEIGSAVETKNLHKGAFQLARRLDKMDGTKLRLFLIHFDRYREHLALDKRAEEQVDLELDAAKKEEPAGKNSGRKRDRSKKAKTGIGAATEGDKFIEEQVAAAEKRGEDTAGLRERLQEEANRATLQ